MTSPKRQLHLGLTVWPSGFHPAGWRLPEARTNGNSSRDFFRRVAQLAERGKFDFFFIGDQVVGLPEWQHERPNHVLRPEALSLAGFVAGVTEKVGIVTTVNVTYSEPYSVARATATLDHISGGRIGWNIVTGEAEAAARNYGRKEHWDNSRRYEWATEFVQVVKGLWDSWEDGARVADKPSGVFIDESKVHRIDYNGNFFSVDGPLNAERPIQGQIPIVNAGRSERSIELGAEYSDIKFTNSSTLGLEGAKAYYADLKARVAAHGRNPDEQFIIPGIVIYTAPTDAEAHDLYRRIQGLWTIPVKLEEIASGFGVDLSGHGPDTRLSAIPAFANISGKPLEFLEVAREQYGTDDITLAELYRSYHRRFGFKEIVGGPSTIADVLQRWFEERAADGFMIFPPYVEGAHEAFVDLVIPELQRRGIFRTEYTGSTLRDHFGLARPPDRYSPVPSISEERADAALADA
ncbi:MULTISPECIES: NtaA/DmoA family FMN-dependent monooxygenase [unclassified Chelatococcus]|uniref:NtaA/DmoA family FMN-dependent monooxygenase n=1 Tax=unclassified Chelatococcus TaxID=2638111 RepID=UPI001BCCC715|nr:MULTISPECIES: NtaA/DmoA family FMN-dependent monooxygenase [unclassified Chelatococcus]CAH1653594.1 LLM class flavin-dependent oxidoreductase [Hyphomicrobiales bacterium]MBS7742881.1 NtaA/DmoA family FMN-dependent monooxygenase [Chelatococcus sp. HY11]MBX3542001.1 NtaA/DmoA family FMN-dependent monooxygenase [Chelatococcus sp.]MCO5074107.1 NtaA/DmoA family FMN-dependent monooxygenase [Chelatococcus sp.]CAH1694511.1 LLM class flavin-dependent oxidoreductase [Hyphomicrobiales bacterium]